MSLKLYHDPRRAEEIEREGEHLMNVADTIVATILGELESKNGARDRALIESRQVVRFAANTIRALHRGDFSVADESLGAGRGMIERLRHDLSQDYPDLYWAGYVQDAQKELAEAYLVGAMIRNTPLPNPIEIGVESAPYLNGLAEAASEMRRYVLDRIRTGQPEQMREAERILRLMDDVYTNLLTVDFPDSITGGLRRTTDSLRAVLERTRGDLTISIRQSELERALLAERAGRE
jgi:translin